MKRHFTYQLMTFVALFSVTLVLTTCKKGEEPPSSDTIVIAKEVKVINNQTWEDQFISLDSTNYTITFSKNITTTQQIKVGDIIVSAAGEGLLRKVKSVSTVNNEIKVQTEPATLTEVIQQGLIEFEQPLSVSQIKSIDYHYAGIKFNTDNAKGVDQTQFNWDINTVLYDNDGNLATTNDQIKLIGTFNCDWQIALRIDIGLIEGLKEVKFGFESEENLDLQLVAGIQYNFEKKVTLATVNFTPIVVTIGIIPVVFTPQLKIIVGIDGSSNASVTSKITQNLSFNAGIKYLKAESWSPYKTFDKNIDFQPPQLNMNASAGAYLKPEILIKIYAIAGPYSNLKIYSRVDADLLQTPWWKLYGGVTMDAGANVDIIDKFTLDYAVSDLIKYEQLLVQATTPPVSLPTVTTNNITTFTSTSATVGGNVTASGGATVTEHGVYWGTSQNPELTGTKLQIGSGTGSFSTSLSGLNPNTPYYVKAYAINSAGTAFGSQVSFTTLQNITTPTVTTTAITTFTSTSATVGGNVTGDGNATVTERGIYYDTSANPETTGTKLQIGNGTGTFSTSLTGLTANSTYYVKAYAINSQGSAYGTQVSFTTSAVATGLSTLTTTAASSITSTTATSGGTITSDGGASVTARGVCWSTTANPTTSNNMTNDGSGIGSFVSNLGGLRPVTTYYIRSYATNGAGTAYGNQLSLTTSQNITAPTVTTTAVTTFTSNSATVGGDVISSGNALGIERGIFYGTSANPETTGTKLQIGTGTGTFSTNLTELSANTTYYVLAYATNSIGTAYGNQVSFTTSDVATGLSTLTTTAASSITSNTATSGGVIANDGGASVTAYGVCWSPSANPTIALSTKTTDGTGIGTFTSNLTGLTASTTYYVRAYATNSVGTAYGNQVSFTTSDVATGLPTLTTTAASSITSTSATSGGVISNYGGTSVTARGVCWSTLVNPTAALSTKTIDGTGIGTFTSYIIGLTANTTYYVRAYATNSVGTAYGNQVSFTTSSGGQPGTVTDIDGNVYNTVTIGTQVWMKENLKTTKYNDGTAISNVTNNTSWAGLITGAYCWYNNNAATYKGTYGALYNWYTVSSGKLCPTGWHVPSDAEWTTLTTYLGGENIAGGKLKETGTAHWLTPNTGATNETGFTALPGGDRTMDGTFYNIGGYGFWWSSTEASATFAWGRLMYYDNTYVDSYGGTKQDGFSVCCLRD